MPGPKDKEEKQLMDLLVHLFLVAQDDSAPLIRHRNWNMWLCKLGSDVKLLCSTSTGTTCRASGSWYRSRWIG